MTAHHDLDGVAPAEAEDKTKARNRPEGSRSGRQGQAAPIARVLGGAASTSGWHRAPCPAHGSTGPSLALKDGACGLVVVCHAGCRARDIIAALRRRGLLEETQPAAASEPDPEAMTLHREAEAAQRRARIALAHDMWGSALPAAGTAVGRYLRARIPGLAGFPATLRLIPPGSAYALHPSGERRPVMIARVEHAGLGLVAVHRTWLAPDGSAKATLDPPRIATGPIGGGAVRLALAGDAAVIGEGLETTLSAMVALHLPGWAALSAGGIERLVLPPRISNVIISVDRDPSGAGERAARASAYRWALEGRRVRLVIPTRIGADFNDLVREARHAA